MPNVISSKCSLPLVVVMLDQRSRSVGATYIPGRIAACYSVPICCFALTKLASFDGPTRSTAR
jgi:hypothetical protein